MVIDWKRKYTGLEAKFPKRPILHRLHPEPEDKKTALKNIVEDGHACRKILRRKKPDPEKVRTGEDMLFGDTYCGGVRCPACDSVLENLFCEKGEWQFLLCESDPCGLVVGVNRISGMVTAKDEFQDLKKYHETAESE